MQIYQQTDDAKTLPISICSFYHYSKKKKITRLLSRIETHLENKETSGLLNLFYKIFFGLKKDQQIRL